MRYTMLVFVILGLVASVSCVCNTTAAWTCASTLASEVIDAGIDNAKVCSAYRKYITCMSNAECSNDSSYTTSIKAANLVINVSCGGAMVTASVLTMILTVFAMLFK
ncbi:uncharacterized protein LOC121379205 isoform X1 [Gigantopelta aegis]|uniref:uncharacterized protein LOC121379205 isoform X1 n=1 Tax=Gigantopelta aegis TaxID=1735272 RepID=UPI001B88C812|nr:uncharacterized protein LOC121379205 isoform X1 [Gigantopelta aegis]